MDAGVIPGADMTPEAALMKLSYVLSKEEWSPMRKREVGTETVTNIAKCGMLEKLSCHTIE